MRKWTLGVATLALASCGGAPLIGLSPTIERVETGVMPVPAAVSSRGSYIYTLGPFDKIAIEVVGLPESQRDLVLDGQGMIAYPLAGDVEAQGLTTTQLSALLAERLQEAYVRDPKVSVNLLEMASKTITLDGEVERPGIYPVHPNLTLMKAVALAGGTSDLAGLKHVLVFRNVEGQQFVGLYDLSAIRLGNYPDPAVYPDDQIVVSESRSRRFLASVPGIVSVFTTPLILILRNV